MPIIEFDSIKQQYTLHGEFVPRVSNIMKEAGLVSYGNIPEEILRNACEFGTNVHYTLDLYDQGQTTPEELMSTEGTKPLASYLQQYIQFKKDTGFEVERIEKRVYSESLWYAGTIDRIGKFKNNSHDIILDFKTTAQPMKSHPIQLSAYQYALTELEPDRDCERYILYLQPDKYRLHKCERESDFNIFVSALNIFNYKRG